MLSSNYAFIIENDIPAKMHLEFDKFSYVMYIFTGHGHWHDASDLIEYPWSVLKISVSLIMYHKSTENISKQAGLRSGPKFW